MVGLKNFQSVKTHWKTKFSGAACCNYQFSLTRKTFKSSTLVLKKTVGSLLFRANRCSQTSPKCAGVFIEEVFSVKAGPLGPTDGRKFQNLPLEFYQFVKRKSVKRAFKQISYF